MEHQTEEREDPSGSQVLPGEHISANRDPILLPDKVLLNAEIKAAVKTLCNGQTGGSTMMQAEDIKALLARTEQEEGGIHRQRQGQPHIWDTREILTRILLTIVVLIPKGTS